MIMMLKMVMMIISIILIQFNHKMDAVRGVETLLETGGQVQGERKGTMRCHVVGAAPSLSITF